MTTYQRLELYLLLYLVLIQLEHPGPQHLSAMKCSRPEPPHRSSQRIARPDSTDMGACFGLRRPEVNAIVRSMQEECVSSYETKHNKVILTCEHLQTSIARLESRVTYLESKLITPENQLQETSFRRSHSGRKSRKAKKSRALSKSWDNIYTNVDYTLAGHDDGYERPVPQRHRDTQYLAMGTCAGMPTIGETLF